MGLRINTNLASLNAQRNLASVSSLLAGNFRRLSTGLRINSAADDPAGLAISERLRAQIASMDQAARNANDGVSLVQTAEGSLDEVGSILSHLRELAVQAGNGTLSDSDRATLNQEFSSLVDEVDRIGHSTQFNGINLLDGSASSVTFQVGPGTTPGIDTVQVSLSAALGTTLSLTSLDIGSGGDVSLAIHNIDAAIDTVSGLRGRLGAAQNRLGYAIGNLGLASENLTAADSRIRDVDFARETALLTRNSILQQANLAILVQANSQPQFALRLLNVS
jgi:flagellin